MAAAHQQAEKRELGYRLRLIVCRSDEVRQHVRLQVVDLDDGDAQRLGKALGKRHAHKQRPQQARAARKGHGVKLPLVDARVA